jgi:hypothetical protein
MREQQFTTPGPVRLDVKVAAGTVRVVTDDAAQSTVVLDGSQKLIDAARVELIGDRLVIAQQRKSPFSLFGRYDEPFDVQVRIPHTSKVSVTTASADATLEGMFGQLDVQSASGNLAVAGEVEGDAIVKTVSGDAHLPRLRGNLSAQTVSGEVAADSVDGAVTLKSVSGDLRVGSVREGSVTVRSVSGDVELGIASGTNVDVDAGSASGMLSSEVPLSGTPGGNGGPTVVIRSSTVSGDFRIFRAA